MSEIRVVLVHGAFRGGWSLEPVAAGLRDRGIDAIAPDLPGAGDRYDAAHPHLSLADHVADVWRHVDRPTILVGHSQGGLIAHAVATSRVPADRQSDHLLAVLHLDAIVPGPGLSAVDVVGLPDGVTAPAPTDWLSPPPRSADDLIGIRLTPAPVAPGIDPMPAGALLAAEHHAYFIDTPPYYPSAVTRTGREAAGEAVTILSGGHDTPFVAPADVVRWVADIAADIIVETSVDSDG